MRRNSTDIRAVRFGGRAVRASGAPFSLPFSAKLMAFWVSLSPNSLVACQQGPLQVMHTDGLVCAVCGLTVALRPVRLRAPLTHTQSYNHVTAGSAHRATIRHLKTRSTHRWPSVRSERPSGGTAANTPAGATHTLS